MLDDIIVGFGAKWLLALVVVFFATLAEGGGKDRRTKADEDVTIEGATRRSAVLGVAAGVATTLSLIFLFVHTLLAPTFVGEASVRFLALGAVIFVAIAVGLIGQGLAGVSPPFHKLCQVIRLPLAVVGLLISGWATVETVPYFLRFIGM